MDVVDEMDNALDPLIQIASKQEVLVRIVVVEEQEQQQQSDSGVAIFSPAERGRFYAFCVPLLALGESDVDAKVLHIVVDHLFAQSLATRRKCDELGDEKSERVSRERASLKSQLHNLENTILILLSRKMSALSQLEQVSVSSLLSSSAACVFPKVAL